MIQPMTQVDAGISDIYDIRKTGVVFDDVFPMAPSLSQIRYSLVVILELNSVSEVQYKDVMMVDDGKYQ